MRIEEFSVSAGSYPGVGLVAREMGDWEGVRGFRPGIGVVGGSLERLYYWGNKSIVCSA